MFDLIYRGVMILAFLVSYGTSAWTLLRMAAETPTTPMDGFNRSIARWGYIGQARGRA